MLTQITPLILTYNELPNIQRTLDKLTWAKRIVVVDSGSTDGTIDILFSYKHVDVIHRQFTDFKSQWNRGLAQITTPWVLSLDADYELSDEFIGELKALVPEAETLGYWAQFTYRIHGRELRGSLYPRRVVLFRIGSASYRQEGHTQKLEIKGKVLSLESRIYHDDRKSLMRWITSQHRYAHDEAVYLLNHPPTTWADKLRKTGWIAPIAIFLYTLLVKRCILDGWPGWSYALQRGIAEALLALEITDRRLRSGAVANSKMPGQS